MEVSTVKIADHFDVPYATLRRWKLEEDRSWRKRLYRYLEKRYIRETLEALK